MPQELDTARRRPFITNPGEQLWSSGDPFTAVERFLEVSQLFGLPPARLIASPLVSVPIPRYPTTPSTPRRWPAAFQDALGHPLLWLPNRLAYAYRLQDDDGTETTEPADAWAVRVMMEVTHSGLYNPVDASWVDVLDLYDLDLSNAEHRDRIERWQMGESDEILDAIDLTHLCTVPDQPHWALDAVTDQLPDLYAITWAMHADALLAAVETLAAPYAEHADNLAILTDKGDLIAELAQHSFAAMPGGTSGASEKDFWAAVGGDHAGTTAERYRTVILGAMRERLSRTRATYWPRLEELGTPAVA